MDIRSLVEDFTTRLGSLIEREVLDRARAALGGAMTNDTVVVRKLRRKLPRQLCPVPGCKNTAAPVFGMVCSEHKGVPKAKIRKYREQRRAKKLRTAA
jgi:hypothetical protein